MDNEVNITFLKCLNMVTISICSWSTLIPLRICLKWWEVLYWCMLHVKEQNKMRAWWRGKVTVKLKLSMNVKLYFRTWKLWFILGKGFVGRWSTYYKGGFCIVVWLESNLFTSRSESFVCVNHSIQCRNALPWSYFCDLLLYIAWRVNW